MARSSDRRTEDLQSFFGQLHELEKRVLRGSLPLDRVRPALQTIIEGKVSNSALTSQLPSWWVGPMEQLRNVRRWNEQYGWGFEKADFPNLVPMFTPRAPLEVLVLAVYLPAKAGSGVRWVSGYIRTAEELWQIARARQPSWKQRRDLKLDADHLRLLPGAEEFREPGIRWMALDLGANWNDMYPVSPWDVRSPSSPHAEVLAAAAHFPDWIKAMDGETVPYVWLPGYQVTLLGMDPWANTLSLRWFPSIGEVWLEVNRQGARFEEYAVPTCRTLS